MWQQREYKECLSKGTGTHFQPHKETERCPVECEQVYIQTSLLVAQLNSISGPLVAQLNSISGPLVAQLNSISGPLVAQLNSISGPLVTQLNSMPGSVFVPPCQE